MRVAGTRPDSDGSAAGPRVELDDNSPHPEPMSEKLREIAPVVTIHAEDLEGDSLETAVLDQLHIG